MSAPSSRFLAILAAAILAAAGLILDGETTSARQAVSLDDDDIGGVVSGPNGSEAGVWVIAETDDFPTRLRKIVVTDDEGRYVLPDLPTRTTRSGCAATGWSIRPRSREDPDRHSI